MNTIDEMINNAPEVPDDRRPAGAAEPKNGTESTKEPENAIPPIVLPQGLMLDIPTPKQSRETSVKFDPIAVGRLLRTIIEAAAPLCIVRDDDYAHPGTFAVANQFRVAPWKEKLDNPPVENWVPREQVRSTLELLREKTLPDVVGEALRYVFGNGLASCETEGRAGVRTMALSFQREFRKVPCFKTHLRYDDIFPTDSDSSEYVVGYRALAQGDSGVTTTFIPDYEVQGLLQAIADEVWRVTCMDDIPAAYELLRLYSRCEVPMDWRERTISMIASVIFETSNLPEYRFYYFHLYLGTELAEIDWLWAQRKKILNKSSP